MAPKITNKSTQVKEQVEGPVLASQIDMDDVASPPVDLKSLDAQIKTLQAQKKQAKEAAKANKNKYSLVISVDTLINGEVVSHQDRTWDARSETECLQVRQATLKHTVRKASEPKETS